MVSRIFAWPLGLLVFVFAAAGPAAAQAPAPAPVPLEAGPSFKPLFELRLRGEPSLHFCWEQASGGGAAGDSRNFFNLRQGLV